MSALFQIALDASSIIMASWGLCEFIVGITRDNRERMIFGLCLGIFAATVAK